MTQKERKQIQKDLKKLIRQMFKGAMSALSVNMRQAMKASQKEISVLLDKTIPKGKRGRPARSLDTAPKKPRDPAKAKTTAPDGTPRRRGRPPKNAAVVD
jgi:hypothetical protein